MFAGSHDISLDEEPHRVIVATNQSIVHPDWNPFTVANDIALIKLPEKIQFNGNDPWSNWSAKIIFFELKNVTKLADFGKATKPDSQSNLEISEVQNRIPKITQELRRSEIQN